MFSVSVSKSLSIYNAKELDEIMNGDRLIISNEKEALNNLREYFSRRINAQYCQTCASDKAFNKSFQNRTINNEEQSESLLEWTPNSFQSTGRVACMNTCYNTAVQVQIAEFFRSFDLNFDKKLTYHEFYKGFTSLFIIQKSEDLKDLKDNLINEVEPPHYVWIDEIAIRNLFIDFDLNNDSFVDFSDFVRGIRVPICKKRWEVLDLAFKRLDFDKDGIIDMNDLKCWYKFNKMYCEQDEKKLEEIILLWMSNFSFKTENKSEITRVQFFDYYYVVSSTVIHDAYFDLLIRNTFHI